MNENQDIKQERNRVLEERFNTISHGIGLLLSILGMVWLLVLGGQTGDVLKIVCFAVYGMSLILLYGASTLYHSVLTRVHETKLQLFDHAAIYLLIAGTYTPFTLLVLGGAWGWSIFGTIWGLAIGGIAFKLRFGNRYMKVSTFVYLAMGWLIVVAMSPLIERMPPDAWAWVIGGGLSYTVGVVFFVWDRLPFNHGIWHLFVLGGSICHYLAVLIYLSPA